MRIFPDKYPKGFYNRQKEDGLSYDDLLSSNLSVLADGIINDNSFLLLVSAQALSVRTGKSTFTQLTAEAWNHIMKVKHNVDLTFDMRNIAFNADEFEEKAFALHERKQKYGVCILDESDDITGHALSQEVVKIKRFLRKSGQLNLLMILILPNFFEFPKTIAVSRSVGLITVDFGDNFSRGHWKFYDFKAKKRLYIEGKKFEDYSVVHPTLYGNFIDCGYLVNEKEYRSQKYRDLKQDSDNQKKKRYDVIRKELFVKTFKEVYTLVKGIISIEKLSTCFNVSDRTAKEWLRLAREGEKGDKDNINSDDHELIEKEVENESTNN